MPNLLTARSISGCFALCRTPSMAASTLVPWGDAQAEHGLPLGQGIGHFDTGSSSDTVHHLGAIEKASTMELTSSRKIWPERQFDQLEVNSKSRSNSTLQASSSSG